MTESVDDGWPESPSDCALFPAPGEAPATDAVLSVIRVESGDCRRPSP